MWNMEIVEYQNVYILHLVKYGHFYILRIDIYNQEISIFDILQNIVWEWRMVIAVNFPI